MIYFALIITILLISIILTFSSKQISPIPYFPSNKQDLGLIINSLNLGNNQIVYDLGAGDGIVIIAAANEAYKKNLNTKFVAVEINPILLLVLNIRRYFNPNKRNIKILKEDIFALHFKNKTKKQYDNITIYLYISPWYLEKTVSNIKKRIENFKIVSYMYPIKSLKLKKKVVGKKHPIYIY